MDDTVAAVVIKTWLRRTNINIPKYIYIYKSSAVFEYDRISFIIINNMYIFKKKRKGDNVRGSNNNNNHLVK